MLEMIKSNKNLYISGLIVFVVILIIGNNNEISYLLSGIWFGFWAGVGQIRKKIEKFIDKSEDEVDFYKKVNNNL